MHEISLSDSIALWKSSGDEIIVVGDIIKDENSLNKAISVLRQKLDLKTGFRVLLEKRIPVSSGLGGGSSDAAAVLKGILNLCDISLEEDEVLNLASLVGSDVPFFIKGGFSIVGGRGESVRKLSFCLNPSWQIVLVIPPYGLSTAEVYSWFEPPYSEMPELDFIVSAFKEEDWRTLRRLLKNDLERPVFLRYPELRDVKEFLEKAGASFSSMSGSGSVIFAIFENKNVNPDLIRALEDKGYKVVLTSFRGDDQDDESK